MQNAQVEELGAFLRERGVQPSAIDEGTPPETIAQINARLLAAMQTCMQALNLGGLKLQSLIDAVETRCVAPSTINPKPRTPGGAPPVVGLATGGKTLFLSCLRLRVGCHIWRLCLA